MFVDPEVLLNREALVKQASQVAEAPSHELSPDVLRRLGFLCADLSADPALSQQGRHLAHNELLSLISNYFLISSHTALHTRRGTLGDPPVIIAGLPRSATTLLQHLFALDDRFQTLPAKVALRPVEHSGNGLADRETTARFRLRMLERLATDVLQAHPFVPEGPEECNVAHASWIDGLQLAVLFDSPQYFEEFARCGLQRSTLEGYVSLLRSWSDGRQWVLKSPGYSHSYALLPEVMGPYMLVEVRRPLNQVMDSWISLVARTRKLFYRTVDVAQLYRAWEPFWTDVCRQPAGSPSTNECLAYASISFDRLATEPLSAYQSTLEELGFEALSVRSTARIRRFLEEDPLRRWGKHRY